MEEVFQTQLALDGGMVGSGRKMIRMGKVGLGGRVRGMVEVEAGMDKEEREDGEGENRYSLLKEAVEMVSRMDQGIRVFLRVGKMMEIGVKIEGRKDCTNRTSLVDTLSRTDVVEMETGAHLNILEALCELLIGLFVSLFQ